MPAFDLRYTIHPSSRALALTLAARREVTIDASTERLADIDQRIFRGSERLDIIVNDVGDASVQGPVACLIGTS